MNSRLSLEERENFTFKNGRLVPKHGTNGTKRTPKVNAKRHEEDGIIFHSGLDHKCYCSLKILKRTGMIFDFKHQIKFELQSYTKSRKKQRVHHVDFGVWLEPTETYDPTDAILIEMKGEWTDHHQAQGPEKRGQVEFQYGVEINLCQTVKQAESLILAAVKELQHGKTI